MKVTLIDADSLFYGICFGKFNQFSKKEKNGYDIREYYNHLDSWMEDIIKKTNSTHYLAFWTKGKVFRHNINNTYKSGRPEDKPMFFDDLRKHFREKWNGIHVDLLEAEDCVSIYAKHYKSKNIDYTVAHIDHDLLQIEGKHYDFKKDELYEVTIDRANYNLFRQVCTGCTTDKVQGLKGIGDKTADKYFESLGGEEGFDLYDDLHLKSLSLYIQKEGFKQGISHFSECFNLVYLLTTPEEVKSITGQDFEFKEPYYFSTVNPNIFGNFTKSEDDSDLTDFLK